MSNEAFPFGTMRSLSVAGCELDALRITYVGELGYELHVPVELAVTVYDAVMAAGRPHGLVNAGYRAIESCRLEKGYRAWGADIGPDHTPIEAGLGWAVKDRSPVDFIGRDAVAGQRERASPSAWRASRPDPRSCCSAAKRSIATASASAGCRAQGSGTRSTARSATATFATAMG